MSFTFNIQVPIFLLLLLMGRGAYAYKSWVEIRDYLEAGQGANQILRLSRVDLEGLPVVDGNSDISNPQENDAFVAVLHYASSEPELMGVIHTRGYRLPSIDSYEYFAQQAQALQLIVAQLTPVAGSHPLFVELEIALAQALGYSGQYISAQAVATQVIQRVQRWQFRGRPADSGRFNLILGRARLIRAMSIHHLGLANIRPGEPNSELKNAQLNATLKALAVAISDLECLFDVSTVGIGNLYQDMQARRALVALGETVREIKSVAMQLQDSALQARMQTYQDVLYGPQVQKDLDGYPNVEFDPREPSEAGWMAIAKFFHSIARYDLERLVLNRLESSKTWLSDPAYRVRVLDQLYLSALAEGNLKLAEDFLNRMIRAFRQVENGMQIPAFWQANLNLVRLLIGMGSDRSLSLARSQLNSLIYDLDMGSRSANAAERAAARTESLILSMEIAARLGDYAEVLQLASRLERDKPGNSQAARVRPLIQQAVSANKAKPNGSAGTCGDAFKTAGWFSSILGSFSSTSLVTRGQ